MDCGDRLPILDVDEKRASANDLSHRCAGLLQGDGDYLKASPRLRCGISDAHGATIWTKRSSAGNCNHVSNAHGTRNPNLRLVWAATGDELAHGNVNDSTQARRYR